MKHLLATLALLVMLTGCAKNVTTPTPGGTTQVSDHALQVTAKALTDIAQVVGTLDTAVINANAAKLISGDATRAIISVSTRVLTARDQAATIVRGLSALPPEQRTQLTNIFGPILSAVNDSLSNGLVTITDPNTKSAIQASLASLQLILASVQAALGA